MTEHDEPVVLQARTRTVAEHDAIIPTEEQALAWLRNSARRLDRLGWSYDGIIGQVALALARGTK